MNGHKRRTALALGSALFAMAWVGVAAAQESAGGASGDQLVDIVVTAQKREQNLQSIPLSVTALSEDDLSSRGIGNPMDLQGQLPGVTFQPNNELFVSVRGIGTFNLQPGVDSAVAYTLDGNFIAHPGQLPTVLFDLQRVEAIRGPQGTLYGRNANAGAINFVTNRPTYDFGVSGSIGIGNYSQLQSEVTINTPIAEGFALRGSFASRRHDPYLDDGHNDENQIAARLRALIEPSERLSILATVDYVRRDDANVGVSECPPHATEAACANVKWDPFDGNDEANPDDYALYKSWGAYAQVDLDLDIGTLTYIPTYRESNSGSITTPTRPYAETLDKNWMYTHELRLASASGSSLQWVAGLYYSRERMERDTLYYWDTNPAIPRGPNFLVNFFNVDYYKAESKAAFAQVTIPLTEAFRLTGGLRYTDESKIMRGAASAYAGTPANPVLVSVPIGDTLKDDRVTWKVGVEADVAPDHMLYANVSTGFKSGGVSQADPNITLPTTYGPEKITAYQIGSKNRFFDRRLQINAEAFYYDYTGFQTILPSFQPSGLLYFLVVNSQKARFYGGEIEATFLATPNDRLDLAVSLLDARLTKFVVGTTDNSGRRPGNAPTYTVNAGYQHIFDLGDSGSVTARVETRFVGKYYVNSAANAGGLQDAYHQSNANLTYAAPDDRWGVSAWIRNIENKAVLYNVNPPGTRPVTIANIMSPRTFGVTLRGAF